MWIPTNKKTGQQYDPITDAEKAEREKDMYYKARYTFKYVPGGATTKSAEPVVAVTAEPPVTVFTNDTSLPPKKSKAPEPIEAKRVLPTKEER